MSPLAAAVTLVTVGAGQANSAEWGTLSVSVSIVDLYSAQSQSLLCAVYASQTRKEKFSGPGENWISPATEMARHYNRQKYVPLKSPLTPNPGDLEPHLIQGPLALHEYQTRASYLSYHVNMLQNAGVSGSALSKFAPFSDVFSFTLFSCSLRYTVRLSVTTIRYDTIRDAILACARKPT